MFQSPFGELKIGKATVKDLPAPVGMFQSPFGELKIGKFPERPLF